MKKFLAIAALFAALLFVPTTAEANCRPLRAALKVATAPARLVVKVKPVRSVLRLAALPVRALRLCR